MFGQPAGILDHRVLTKAACHHCSKQTFLRDAASQMHVTERKKASDSTQSLQVQYQLCRHRSDIFLCIVCEHKTLQSSFSLTGQSLLACRFFLGLECPALVFYCGPHLNSEGTVVAPEQPGLACFPEVSSPLNTRLSKRRSAALRHEASQSDGSPWRQGSVSALQQRERA